LESEQEHTLLPGDTLDKTVSFDSLLIILEINGNKTTGNNFGTQSNQESSTTFKLKELDEQAVKKDTDFNARKSRAL